MSFDYVELAHALGFVDDDDCPTGLWYGFDTEQDDTPGQAAD